MGIEVPGISAPISSQPLNVTQPIALSTNPTINQPEIGNGSVSLVNFTSPLLSSARYTEQLQKKKLIWGAKKTAEPTATTTTTTNKWETAKFSQDSDGKMASKFLRLMGAKNVSKSEDEGSADTTADTGIQKREEMFSSMEHQYEVARQATHTMRGMGLGFGSSRPF